MISIQGRIVTRIYRIVAKGFFEPHLKLKKLRKGDLKQIPHKHQNRISQQKISGSDTLIIKPRQGAPRKALLFLHGGAYVCGPSRFHLDAALYLADELNCTVYHPVYPKAPENPYPAAINRTLELYLKLSELHSHENILLMGDSAGGGLALALTMKLRDESIPLPAKIALLSPWLDISMAGDPDALKEQEKLDCMLSLPGLMEAGRLYAGLPAIPHEEDNQLPAELKNLLTAPYLSPLYGRLQDLPPGLITIGTHELLLSQIDQLVFKAKESGWDLTCIREEGMFHVWPLGFSLVPESKSAMSKIIEFLTEK